MAESVYKYFQLDESKKLVEEIKSLGINTENLSAPKSIDENNPCFNKT